jgi:hypothetical protein
MKRKNSVSLVRANQLEATVRNRVKAWPERMDYGQLDDLCKLLGCELFAGLDKTWRKYEKYDGGGAQYFLSLATNAGQLAKDYVKKRGFIFISNGEKSYWNATKVSPTVVAQWQKEKVVRLKAESEKYKAEIEVWWANLAPPLKEALLTANRNAPTYKPGRRF